ncbi:MAG TPA: hypothetical protein DCR40_10040 [Prolixibacteraceae bacterium]|nr:MAG: hypothetical protein US34_C0024G0005 [Candidatus Nomurabacteria bacterium GW2011_GWC2_36_9]HAQ19554.1 hypothetical protein [Prolixibacteraceae bacterium]
MITKLTKTDHHEQSLQMDQETKYLVREAMEAMLSHQFGSIELRDRAMKLKRMLEDPANEDRPAIFQKTHGMIITCPDCGGSQCRKIFPDDRKEEIEFHPCTTCKGEGQLFHEVIRKSYVPTEYHRRKLAK